MLTGVKNWTQSKTIISSLVAFIAILASATGHALPDDMKNNLTDILTEALDIIGMVSSLAAAWARTKATQQIAPIVTPKG